MAPWDAFAAEWYVERYGEHPTNRLGVDAVDLRPDDTVLDVGCGTGAALRHASLRVTEGRLIGVDMVPRMVELARERLVGHPAAARITFEVGQAHALPVADGVVDVALAFDTYDHWGEHQAAGLAELRRVLKPGGRLVVVKDATLPEVSPPFPEAAWAAGFAVEREAVLDTEGVEATLWVMRAV